MAESVAVMARGRDMLLRVVPEGGQDVLPEAYPFQARLTDDLNAYVGRRGKRLQCWVTLKMNWDAYLGDASRRLFEETNRPSIVNAVVYFGEA